MPRLKKDQYRENFELTLEIDVSSGVAETVQEQNNGWYVPTVVFIPMSDVIYNDVLSSYRASLLDMWKNGHLTEDTVLAFVQREIPHWLNSFRNKTFCSNFICYVKTIFESSMNNGNDLRPNL